MVFKLLDIVYSAVHEESIVQYQYVPVFQSIREIVSLKVFERQFALISWLKRNLFAIGMSILHETNARFFTFLQMETLRVEIAR